MLYMFGNNLTGEIPASYANCSTLLDFRVNNNSLSGTIPTGIWGLPHLLNIDIKWNSIEGPITSDVKNAKSLATLHAGHNCLSGELPAEISKATSLKFIQLSDNRLSGNLVQLPTSIIYFIISNNRLTGEIPHVICNVSFLERLDISNNGFSGKILQCLGNFSNHLRELDLQMNSFHGTIPITLANSSFLQYLAFSDNDLEGPLPRSLVNCKTLEVLDLGNYKISDFFPYWLGALPNLVVLVLKSNKFHGPIGNHNTSGKFFNGLEILDIRNNKINDFFPYWLEALHNIHVLVLKSNRFHGPIGNHNTSGIFFFKLLILDLSHNKFIGPLPINYFENLNAMKIKDEDKHEPQYLSDGSYQESVVLIVKGLQIKLKRILTIFTTIDLSSNKFEGEIPEVLGKLTVLRLLNLFHNSLTSHIPSSLANLSRLESLDLSSNRLTGQIPIQLTSLNIFGHVKPFTKPAYWTHTSRQAI